MDKIVELIDSGNIELGFMLAFSQYGKNENTFSDLIIKLIEAECGNSPDYLFDIFVKLNNGYSLNFWRSRKKHSSDIIRIAIVNAGETASHKYTILKSFNIYEPYHFEGNTIIIKMNDLNDIYLPNFINLLKELFNFFNDKKLLAYE